MPEARPLSPHDFWRVVERPGPAHLVLFTARGCGACRAMKRAVGALDAPWSAWEVDAHDAAGLVEALDVFHLPALFYWEDGEWYGAVEAPPVPEALRRAVEAARAAGPRDPP